MSFLRDWPVYPLAIAAAAMLGLFLESAATIEGLARPLLVAVSITLLLQVGLSAVFRSRQIGAYVTLCIALLILDWPALGAILAAIPACVVLAGWFVRRGRSRFPWPRATEFLNLVGVTLLVLSVAVTWNSGALSATVQPDPATKVGSGPDIYLILLDGYPRADTLRKDFGLDNSPFLSDMESQGFEVADSAHSNYNFTALTLASTFNVQQIKNVDGLGDPSPVAATQFRALSKSINSGRVFDELRTRGYEIVSVPSPAGIVSLRSADRVYDDGAITEFEMGVLASGITPLLFPGVQRTLVMNSLRDRIVHEFDTTVEVAKERTARPKLVFTHIMSPHVPILFGADGSPREGWPCFPGCGAFDGGWRFGDEVRAPMAGQVQHLNDLVLDSVERIITASPEPPIIVVFSDHGGRHHLDDRAEMLRSLLLTYTPGRVGLFPEDASAVNLFAYLLNGYFAANIRMASEEAYFVDVSELQSKGPLRFALQPSSVP